MPFKTPQDPQILLTTPINLWAQRAEVREAVIHGVTVLMIYVFTFKAVTIFS